MRALSLGLICAIPASLFLADIGSAHGGEAGPKAKPEKATVHVLGPGSEKAISKLLSLGEKLSDGSSLNATIKGSAILVTAGVATKPTLRVTVVHSEDAAKGAKRAGGVSVDPKPGPAPPALVNELVSRIKASKVTRRRKTISWYATSIKATTETTSWANTTARHSRCGSEGHLQRHKIGQHGVGASTESGCE